MLSMVDTAQQYDDREDSRQTTLYRSFNNNDLQFMTNSRTEKEGVVDVIVLAAGKGRRMNLQGNKMFHPIKGIPVIYRTLCRMDRISYIRRIIVVIREEERVAFETMIQKFGELGKISLLLAGGGERYDSVKNGLRYILEHPEADIVMTHDGARPFITESLVEKVLEGVARSKITIPVQEIGETVRQKNENGSTRIVDRDRLYLTQTPQAFFVEDIEPCFFSDDQAGQKLTDEAGYFEHAGRLVNMVSGDKRNIKITTPEDLAWASYLLEHNRDLQLDYLD